MLRSVICGVSLLVTLAFVSVTTSSDLVPEVSFPVGTVILVTISSVSKGVDSVPVTSKGVSILEI